MTNSFEYPSIKTILPTTYNQTSNKIKFGLRKKIANAQIQALQAYVNQDDVAYQFFSQYKSAPYGLIHVYVNRQFNKQERLEVMLRDLDKLKTLFEHNSSMSFKVKIAQIDDSLSLVLGANPGDMKEGFLAFTLYNENQEILYNFSFSFLEDNALVITSTQGPSLEDAKEVMRKLTKQMHGLRPQQFAIWMMQTLAQQLQIESLFGIAQNQQVKVRVALKKRIQINYDDTWPQYEGVLSKEGYWKLPLVSEQKKIEDVASKKRAMYRRRYAMQEQIAQSLQEKLILNHKQ